MHSLSLINILHNKYKLFFVCKFVLYFFVYACICALVIDKLSEIIWQILDLFKLRNYLTTIKSCITYLKYTYIILLKKKCFIKYTYFKTDKNLTIYFTVYRNIFVYISKIYKSEILYIKTNQVSATRLEGQVILYVKYKFYVIKSMECPSSSF